MSDILQQSFLRWLLDEEQARQDLYRAYREYYDGEHSTQLSDRQRKYLQLKVGEEFRSNYCPIVVDALCERLKVTGFAVEGEQDETLWDWWQRNRMDGVQGTVHLAAARDGDAYLIVEWDNERGRPTFSFEPALCDGEGVQVVYSDERNVPMLATKRWQMTTEGKVGKQRRMNVYREDRIERYISDSDTFEGAWQPYSADGVPAVEPWMGHDGQPLGLPVIHFRNKDCGYNYGASELRDVLPLQNALNKTVIDLMAAADTTAFRIFWMIGDDPSSLSVAPGTWVYSTRPPSGDNGAQVGFFPGEDLSNLIALKDSIAIEIARVTRTPVSYFQVSGQRPAEGTLKQEESGLVGKVKDRQVAFGNAWEDAMIVARRLWNTYGSGTQLDETQQVSAMWDDPETRNEKLLIDGLKVKAELGVPQEQLWREMGYDAEQIAEMQDMKAAAQMRQTNLGSQLLKQFDRGQPVPPRQEEQEEEEQNEQGS